MALDPAANFVRGNTDAAIDATQTSVSVVDASIFPDPATESEYNVVIWDAANHPRPDQDPDVEILRVTATDTGTNTLTVVRAQEGTSGAAHPSGSAVHLSPTAKMFSDIQTKTQGLSDDGKSLNIGSINSAPVFALAGERTLLEALQEVPVGGNGEFSDMFLGEVQAVPSEGGPAFSNVDFQDINGASDATPNGVTLRGTGMQASTPIIGTGDHTVKLSTNDAYLSNFSVRQEDDTGDYDAIHISEREAKVRDIGIDAAPRNGVRVDNNWCQLSGLEISGTGDWAMMSTVGSLGNQISEFQIKTPSCENGIWCRGEYTTISDGIVRDVNSDAVHVEGNLSSVSNVVAYRPGNRGLIINSALSIANIFMLVYGAGGIGALINGDYVTANLMVYDSAGDAVEIRGSNNTVHVTTDGDVLLTADSSDNTLVGHASGTVTDNGTNNDTSGLS